MQHYNRGMMHINDISKKEPLIVHIGKEEPIIDPELVAERLGAIRYKRKTKFNIIKERYENGLVIPQPFSILIDNFHTDINVGLLVRTAAALGASEIFIVGEEEWQHNVACAADKFIKINHFNNNHDMYEVISGTKYNIVCLEQTVDAEFLPIKKYPEKPIFILGNETTGVSEFWLNKAKLIAQIKMLGGPKSLNVNVAAGIIISDYLNTL